MMEIFRGSLKGFWSLTANETYDSVMMNINSRLESNDEEMHEEVKEPDNEDDPDQQYGNDLCDYELSP